MNETVYKVATLEETREFANKWLNDLILQFKDKNSAVVVGLSGHLGAGKTAFTKIIAELMGIQETVTSPTFVIMKSYDLGSNFPWNKMIHMDLYRLENKEDLKPLKFAELIAGQNLIIVEWPENVGLKVDIQINFSIVDTQGLREIKVINNN
jgi:tRNA threonylcarbamoyl adenosine modification protein YjeE